MIAKPCQSNEVDYFCEWFPWFFVETVHFTIQRWEMSNIVVNVYFVLRQPDNWALNKTKGTGYSGFVGPKKAFSVRFFYDSSTDKAKRRKNRENISAQRVGCTENGSVTTRSLEFFAFLFNARKSLAYWNQLEAKKIWKHI